MLKKWMSFMFAALLLCGMLALHTFAEDGNFVFSDGSSNGNDTYDGLTPETPKRSLGSLDGTGAMSVLGENGGTMIISFKCRPGGSYTFPEMKGPLTITSVWNGVDYREYEPISNPGSGVFKAPGNAEITIGTDTTFTGVILFQENAQNALIVPSGKTLTLTDTVVLMTKPGNDYYWKVIIEEGGKLICTADAQEKLTIENKGGTVETYGAVELKMTVNSKTAYVNGEAKTLDAEPIIRQNRTMLPVRFVAENLGAEVAWDGNTSTATLTGNGVVIEITIGATSAKVNGETVALDSPAFIENNRTYLPVRFVAEKLGGTVTWDGTTSTATITK